MDNNQALKMIAFLEALLEDKHLLADKSLSSEVAALKIMLKKALLGRYRHNSYGEDLATESKNAPQCSVLDTITAGFGSCTTRGGLVASLTSAIDAHRLNVAVRECWL